ncbi:unnamed protein product [Arabidopsis thaliana]|uniref:Uncharacterized protein n=1 Tax=Arabidopsis thaliana TaxID=3702 RepID=A0A5S9XGV1_ARATH|nr:unnamed protein product [Arabidopsis thaliana]
MTGISTRKTNCKTGAQKRKKQKKDEELVKSLSNSMLRYVKRSKSGKFDESDRVGDENENHEDDKAGEETMIDCDKEECEKISKEDDVPVD